LKMQLSRKDYSAPRRYFVKVGESRLDQNPLGAAFDEFVHEHAQIGQDKAADVEAEELGGVTSAEFETDVRRRRQFEARVLDLSRDLVYQS
jgi:hypothetical protein